MRNPPTYGTKPRRSSKSRADQPMTSQATLRPRVRSQRPVAPFPPPAHRANELPRWGVSVLRLGAATVVAALVPFTLARLGLARGIDDEMSSVGLDAERVQVIESALVSFVGALVAGILLRWRTPVWLGALLYFVVL